MWCGARAPHARAAYAKAAEIRSEPCSLTALRLNLQFFPGETPSFLCWRPEWLSGLQFCSATSRYSDGAPRGSRGKPFPPTPGVCWPVGGAGPRVHPINGVGGGAPLVPAVDRGLPRPVWQGRGWFHPQRPALPAALPWKLLFSK